LECVRKRIDSVVDDLQFESVLMHDKRNLAPAADDGALLDIATHPEPLPVRLIAHLTQFRYGLIVCFALADPTHRKPDEDTDNYNHQSRKLRVGLHISLLKPS